MIVMNPQKDEIDYIFRNLRPKSLEELTAVGVGPLDAARMINGTPGFKAAVLHQGRPAALFGAYKLHHGVWEAFGFGTDEWIKVWRLVTLVAKRDIIGAVRDTGAHRGQCISPASHTDTHKWLRFLGATHEVAMPQYGIHKEDFVMFSWLWG